MRLYIYTRFVLIVLFHVPVSFIVGLRLACTQRKHVDTANYSRLITFRIWLIINAREREGGGRENESVLTVYMCVCILPRPIGYIRL